MLVTLGPSPTGIVTSGQTTLVFGFVNMKYDTCDSVAVGETVLFDQTKAQTVQYGSTIYYVVDEQFISFKQLPLP